MCITYNYGFCSLFWNYGFLCYPYLFGFSRDFLLHYGEDIEGSWQRICYGKCSVGFVVDVFWIQDVNRALNTLLRKSYKNMSSNIFIC